MWALEHAERFRPVRSDVLLRLWRYPAFYVWRSWTVFGGVHGLHLVREVLWNQPCQVARLFDPLHGLRELGKPLPMFRVQESTVPTGPLAPLIARARELFPPPPEPDEIVLDGEGRGAVVVLDGEELRAEWWCGLTEEWRPLIEWADELQALLTGEA